MIDPLKAKWFRGTRFVVITMLLACAAVATLQAQTSGYKAATGVPAFSTKVPVENGFINTANGDLHLEIPLGSFPQRGGRSVRLTLMYDSNIWYSYYGGVYGNYWANNGTGYWHLVTSADSGYVTDYVTDDWCGDNTTYWTYNSFVYTEANGTQHPFAIGTQTGTENCGFSDDYGAMGYATDSSGFFINADQYGNSKIYAPDGTEMLDQNASDSSCSGWGDANLPQDSNGNYYNECFGFSTSYPYTAQTITDTLGRTLVTTTADSSTTTYYDVPNALSGTSRYTITSSNISVSTSFGVSPYSEYSGTIPVVTSIGLPDGTSYSFTYDSGTSGNYGELTSMTLPTGGVIDYGYTTFQDAYGNKARWIDQRKVSTDGVNFNTWGYAPSVVSTCSQSVGYCQNVTESKPNGDYTVYKFTLNGGAWSGEIDYNTGSSTLLATSTKSYDYSGVCPSGASCISPGAAYIVKQKETTSFPSGPSTTTTYSIDQFYGNVTQVAQWKFGNSTMYPDRTTSISYENATGYISANLLNRPSAVTVTDGSGHLCAETDFGYDNTAPNSSGVTQNHTSVSTQRGNLTSTTRKLFSPPCQSSSPTYSSLTTNYVVYDTGTVYTSEDPNSNYTTYSYSNYGAYVSEIQRPTTGGVAHNESFAYDANTGLLTSYTNENSQTTSFSYDNLGRPAETSFPDGGQVNLSYANANTIEQTIKINSSSNTDSFTYLDGLGRRSQTKSAVPSSTCSGGYVYVDTAYDSNGRRATVSNPDCTSTTSDDLNTTYAYDGLNRGATVTEQDGSSTVTTSFSGNCTTVTDEAGEARKSCVDGLGGTTGVWEDPSTLNYETDYTYDTNNNITQVQQKGGASSSYWRTRTFTYDSVSRVLSAADPESGMITYGYDFNGNLTSQVAPQANQTGSATTTTTYCYDALNRLTMKAYTSTSCSSPAVTYVYDGVSPPAGCSVGSFSFSGSLSKPLRSAMCDSAGTEAWRYDDVSGTGTSVTDQRITNSVTKSFTNTYNYDGSLASIVYYPGSGRTITYGVNVAEQPTSAVDTTNTSYPINYATGAAYAPHGALSSLYNGASNILSTWIYNSRLLPCRMAVNSSGSAPTTCSDTSKGNVLDLEYSFGSNGNASGITNNIDTTRSQSFSYDALNRITQAETTSTYSTSPSHCWGETYTVDPWANLSGITPITGSSYNGCSQESGLSLTIGTNNQITSSGYSYDAAGNLTGAPPSGTSFTYNAEGQMTQAASFATAGYLYDGDGRRVAKTSGSTAYELYWYGLNPAPLAESDGSGNITNEYIFFAGKRIARRVVSGQ